MVPSWSLPNGWNPARRLVTGWVVASAALLVLLVVGYERAQPADAKDDASVTEVDCGILLPGILPEGQVLSTIGRLVISPSGTATLVCRGRLDPELAPSAAVIITDIPCALGEGGQVGESQVRVAPSGEVLLVCHNNPGSEPFPTPGGD